MACLVSGLAGLAAWPARGPVRLEVGGFSGGALTGAWSRSRRADIDPQAATDGETQFYYRSAPAMAGMRFPLVASDAPLSVRFRGRTTVRSAVAVFASGKALGEVVVAPGPWDRHALEVPADRVRGVELDLSLALKPLPLVRGSHSENPELQVDYLEVESPTLRLTAPACLLVAAVPASAFAFAWIAGVPPSWAAGAAAALAGATLVLVRAAPAHVALAIPRLVPCALLGGLAVAWAFGRLTATDARDRMLLACLTAAGILFHGSVAFFPDHNPPDLEIHVRRTVDLGSVPLEYDALLRYGSQLPTASQDQGSASVALGDKTLIPYSPLPYLFYYGAYRLGIDLYWGMTVLDVVLAMAVAPCLWLAARKLLDPGSAWLASILYSLDLAVWHHVGRSHAPAVFGGALGTAALLYLMAEAQWLGLHRRALTAAAVLGVAALGYSSLVVLFGLFGLVLMALLVADARGLDPEARRGVAVALVLGGLLAGVLFYFHYLPGLLGGAAGVEAGPDPFPGKAFFIFHNESKLSLRLWALGFWIPLATGLAAAPFALYRLPSGARPVAVSWLAAWALLMLLKEPSLFPKLLRWAKEDQFLSPLLCLLVAAAAWGLPRAWLRWGASLLAIGTALWLQLRDFAHHADSLRL